MGQYGQGARSVDQIELNYRACRPPRYCNLATIEYYCSTLGSSGMATSRRFLFLRLVATMAVCAAMALCYSDCVFSQAGSAGGTVGKSDKSLSGDQPEQSPERDKSSAAPAPNSSTASKIFHNPSIGGIRLDRCLQYGANCDEPAASAWCRSNGLTRASAWSWENLSSTVGQDGHSCSGRGPCGGFSTILCE
jgi:hypothetical protein